MQQAGSLVSSFFFPSLFIFHANGVSADDIRKLKITNGLNGKFSEKYLKYKVCFTIIICALVYIRKKPSHPHSFIILLLNVLSPHELQPTRLDFFFVFLTFLINFAGFSRVFFGGKVREMCVVHTNLISFIFTFMFIFQRSLLFRF